MAARADVGRVELLHSVGAQGPALPCSHCVDAAVGDGARGVVCAWTDVVPRCRLCLQLALSHWGDLDTGSDGPPTTQSGCRWVNTCLFGPADVAWEPWATSQSLFPAEETARG